MINDIYELRQQKLEENGYASYKDYLLSEEWQTIKRSVRNRKGARWNLCNICASSKNLEIHHSSYKVIGTINPHDTVKLLCRSCHQKVHDLSKLNKKLDLYKACSRVKRQMEKEGKMTLSIEIVNRYNNGERNFTD